MRERSGRLLSAVAVLAVFAVFAVGILGVLLEGAGIYQRLTQRSQYTYDRRTCAQYIATKIRQTSGELAVEGDTLVLAEQIGQECYVTRIYCHDGWLMELFAAADGYFAPEDGEKLLSLEAMEPTLENGLLTVNLTNTDGSQVQLRLALRNG